MKLGISLPLSISSPNDFDVESVANDVLNSIHFAQKYLNTNHELMIFDNQNTLPGAQAAIKLFKKEQVDCVLGLPTSDEVHRSAAALLEANLIAITSMATSPKLSEYKHIYRTRPSDLNGIKLLAKKISRQAPENVLILSEDTAYAADFGELISQQLALVSVPNKLVIIKREIASLSLMMQNIPNINYQAVCLSTQDEETFWEYLKAVRVKFGPIQIYGSSMAGSRKFQELAGVQAKDIIYVSPPKLGNVLTKQGNQYLLDFEKLYGKPKTGNYAVILSHAAFCAADQASKNAEAFHLYLSKKDFVSAVIGEFCFRDNEIYSEDNLRINRFCEQELVQI